ncbi:hypothetical protein KY331_00110 [Candidatus Woesearchaeota archaeon]|nr:hypothetical protein [Candidatus Woesearchaeota archaeon]
MTNCNCKEPCEDCKEEKVDLDNISGLLFNEVSNENVQEEKEQKPKRSKNKVKKSKAVKKESPRKIECENINYKDPVSEEYKLMWNNKMGCTVWDTETRTFNF